MEILAFQVSSHAVCQFLPLFFKHICYDAACTVCGAAIGYTGGFPGPHHTVCGQTGLVNSLPGTDKHLHTPQQELDSDPSPPSLATQAHKHFPLPRITINLLPLGLHVYSYWSNRAPSANLVPMIHSVMREAGREYWLTYSSAKGATLWQGSN